MVVKPIYLDYQATTPVDSSVVEAMLPYFSVKFFNPSSKNFNSLGVNSDIEKSRTILANALNCNSNEIVFSSGATESINLAIKGLFDFDTNGHIITLKTEHSAVLNTCKNLEKKGVKITYLDVENNGIVDVDKLLKSIQSNTKLVAIMHVNNEIGVIQPIEKIGKICAENKITFFVDAAQSFGKIPIDVQKFNIDMLAISGHKIYAPKGIGALYINKKTGTKITAIINGGGQENGLRSGTLNVPSIIGLGKATQLAMELMQSEQKRIFSFRKLMAKIIFENVSNVIINGDLDNRIAGNLSISFSDVSGDVLINQLDNIILSRGSACNSSNIQGSHVLKAIGVSDELAESTLRISIGRFSTENEIIEAANFISNVVNNIRKISNLN